MSSTRSGRTVTGIPGRASTRQLAYLAALGYSGPEPVSRREASAQITLLLDRRQAKPTRSYGVDHTGKERMPTMAERPTWEADALERLRKINQAEY